MLLQASQWLQLRQALHERQPNQMPNASAPALVRGPPVVLKDDFTQQAMWVALLDSQSVKYGSQTRLCTCQLRATDALVVRASTSYVLSKPMLVMRRMSPAQSVDSADMIPVSSPGSLTVPEMLANIKTTMISKCRPVRTVQPPAENMCLVGQSSGRIKWIQPSGENAAL